MKKLFAISCAALLALMAVASMAATTAFAEAASSDIKGVVFPDEETIEYQVSFDDVTDYAVTYYNEPGSGVSYYKFAFANSTGVQIYSCFDGENEIKPEEGEYYGGTLETIEKIGNDKLAAITGIEYSENGDLYFRDVYGSLYVVRADETYTEKAESGEFEFTDYGEYAGLVSETYGEYTYLYEITDEKKLYVFNTNSPSDSKYLGEAGEAFTGLKKIDGVVYVLGNTLNILENGQANQLSFAYQDYDTELSISVADTYELLRQTGGEIYWASVEADAMLIPVDLDNPVTYAQTGETYFSTSRIRRFSDVQKEEGTAYAHVLVESGNAAIICYGKTTYLVNYDCIQKAVYTASPMQAVYYAVDELNVYSIPFPSESTKAGTMGKGAEISITGSVGNSEISFYDRFYEIKYTDGSGETVKGYVLSSMVSEYDFNDDNPEMMSAERGEAAYDNNVTLCVIIIVLAAIVMVAAIYLTLVLTSAKRKK